jgi:hypothetical protein
MSFELDGFGTVCVSKVFEDKKKKRAPGFMMSQRPFDLVGWFAPMAVMG